MSRCLAMRFDSTYLRIGVVAIAPGGLYWRVRGWESLARLQDIPQISFPVQNGDNLKRRCLGPVNNGVVGITRKRPETQRSASEVGTGMPAHGSLGNKCTSVIDGLFHAVGGFLAVVGNVGPDLEDIAFGERRESIRAHRFDARP